MASTVTYDGVQGAEGGTIFKDIKFWVAQRVPLRSYLLERIKQNGGSVVPLERQADMLIADHAKPRDAPQGSYSWSFIDDSIKNGYKQVEDRYLIGGHPDEPRRAGSGHSSKSTRTPFTKEDDARIARWVLDHPTEQRGNRIWQEYEQINGRHTAQSWRDRYIKKLAILDRSTLERMAASAPVETSPESRSVDQAEEASKVTERNLQRSAAPQTSRKKQRNGDSETTLPLDTAPKRAKETLVPPTTEKTKRPIQHPPVVNEKETSVPPIAEEIERPTRHSPVVIETEDKGKDAFYLDLDDWLGLMEKDIKRRWYIKGTPVELYDLAQALQAAPVLHDSGTVDWTKVAEILGFVNPDSHLLSELQLFYEESLQEFLSSINAFDTDEEEEDDIDEEPKGEEEHVREEEVVSDSEAIAPELGLTQEINWEDGQEDGPPQSYERSSPPVTVSGLKRSADQRQLTPSGNAKRRRRRFDPNMEIPSTPEADLTPELVPAQDPSPSALMSSQWRDYVGESEASQHLPPLPPLPEESQDLGMSIIPQQEPLHQSVESPPPETETLDFTPTPFLVDTRLQERLLASKRRESQAKSSRQRDNSSTHRITPGRAVSLVKTDSKPAARSAVRRSLPTSFSSSRNPTLQKPPPRDSPPRGSDQSNSREIQKWISHYEMEGFSRRVVIEGLRRTTLTPGKMALLVMKHLSEGRDVPSRHEGIWTDRDDGDLEFSLSVDFSRSPANEKEEQDQELAQKAHNRLIKKHGKQRFELRKDFLEAQTTERGHGPDH
ncbi:hypothetical protein FSPOR_11865 [Fusarium sporotrichioides]|uniref:DNA-binding protein RAP1 n=1 Tax=Fusarium sporotrichioides TaxID=5514 RepID=A0A395REU4_FUSSP|nr:hypothetical protein FSPOR_11865 [Fusarium sporotrichioides]